MGGSYLENGACGTSILEAGVVLFDFEGTLVDSQWQVQTAIEECLTALENAGLKRQWYGDNPSYHEIYNKTPSLFGKGHGSADRQLDMAIIDAIYDKYDADAMTGWKLFPDTLDTLVKLKRFGFRMGVVSNVGAAALKPSLHRLGLFDFFTVIISRNEVDRLKPDPQGVLKAAAQLGVEPANAILIGDSLDDIGAARSAGMPAGYLAGGHDSKEAMNRQPADIEITSLSQLPEFLNHMTRPAAS